MAAEPKEEQAQRDVIGKLADRGEATLARLAELPGGTRAMKAFNDLKLRVDDLGKKVRGIDELEQRLEQRIVKLEREVAALRRAQKAAAPKAPAKKPAST